MSSPQGSFDFLSLQSKIEKQQQKKKKMPQDKEVHFLSTSLFPQIYILLFFLQVLSTLKIVQICRNMSWVEKWGAKIMLLIS